MMFLILLLSPGVPPFERFLVVLELCIYFLGTFPALNKTGSSHREEVRSLTACSQQTMSSSWDLSRP